MYKFQYADVQTESPSSAKERESVILQRTIDLLNDAKEQGAQSLASVEAIHFTTRVWTAFLNDLVSDDNQLPDEVRARLISIGIWILKRAEAIRQGESDNYDEVIEISQIIRDGIQ